MIGARDLTKLDALRRAHFPPERNVLTAHLTLFHHLPPSAIDELRRLVGVATTEPPPEARLSAVRSLGRGVAFAVDSPQLEEARERIAHGFAGQLTPQDQAGWRPHITIQNKVEPDVARALHKSLEADFRPQPLAIEGLAAFYYRGGPWEPIFSRRFNRSGRGPRN